MKRSVVLLFSTYIFLSCHREPLETAGITEVEKAVERFQDVMLRPDQKIFESLLADSLTYGHSNGLIEDKATCIASMVSSKYKFTSLDFSEQTIQLFGNTAIVRHNLFGHTHDKGKEPGTIRLKVLQVWFQKNGDWQLVARQAVKIL